MILEYDDICFSFFENNNIIKKKQILNPSAKNEAKSVCYNSYLYNARIYGLCIYYGT
jgi:hypothetical protein